MTEDLFDLGPAATTVVHLRTAHDVYVGRPGPWGNPYQIGVDGDRTEVIALFRRYMESRPDLCERASKELRGKVLGCWCKPKACHGDVLAEVADSWPEWPLESRAA